MDTIAFKNRMEELENGMKALHIDYEFDQNIEFKLEELRKKMDILTKDHDFFWQMSMKAQRKRDELNLARIDLIIKADIFYSQENYEKLKKNVEYQEINKGLERCQLKIDIGARYRMETDKEKYKIMKQIKKLECREMQYNNQNCNIKME